MKEWQMDRMVKRNTDELADVPWHIEDAFACGRCNGKLVPAGRENGIQTYHCEKCGSGLQYECPVCHCPRTLLVNGVCMFCSQEFNFSHLTSMIKGAIGNEEKANDAILN
jgi:hypothetical protein